MTFAKFQTLLKLECTLRRSLHTKKGRERDVLQKALRAINKQLRGEDYTGHLRRILRSEALIG